MGKTNNLNNDDPGLKKTFVKVFVAENIKKYRKIRNITQAKLAELVGLSTRQIARIESLESDTTFDSLNLICSALGVSHEQITRNPNLDEIESKPPLEQAMLLTQAQLTALSAEVAEKGVKAAMDAINKPNVPIYDDSARGKLHKFIDGLSDSEAKYLHMRAQAYVDEARSLASKKYTQYKDKKSK